MRCDNWQGVKSSHSRRDGSAGRINVQMNVRLGIIKLQEEHLRDDPVGAGIIDDALQENNPVLEQAAVDIIDPFFTAPSLNDIRDQTPARPLHPHPAPPTPFPLST